MERHLDAVVAARERLVDGVRDHLVDEVVEAARAGRADVHARPLPDRLEAFEDRDVLCGVSCFSHREKALQIRALRAVDKCIRNERSDRALARLAAAARATKFRSFSSSIAAASSAAVSASLGGRLGRRARGRRPTRPAPAPATVRARSAASSERRSPRRRADAPARAARARTPTADELVWTCSVPSRAMRAGQALRAICSPTAAGHAVDDAADLGLRAEARRARARTRVSRADPGASTSTSCAGLDRQSRALRRGDDCLARSSATSSASTRAPRRVELREHVVEQEQRRHIAPRDEQLRLGEQQRRAPSAAARPASRSRAGRDRRASRRDVVAGAGRAPVVAALEVAVEPRLELGDATAARPRRRAPRRQAELVRDARRSRARARPSVVQRGRRRAPRRASRRCSVHGAIASRDDRPAADAAQRGVSLRDRSRVLRRERARAGCSARRATRSKYARRAAGPPLTIASRSGVKTSVAISRRKLLAASRASRRSASPASRARVDSVDADLERRLAAPRLRARRAPPRRRSGSTARRSRVRGEKPCVPTCSDSSRFVLPAPFGPTDEHDPRLQARARAAHTSGSRGARPARRSAARA